MRHREPNPQRLSTAGMAAEGPRERGAVVRGLEDVITAKKSKEKKAGQLQLSRSTAITNPMWLAGGGTCLH